MKLPMIDPRFYELMNRLHRGGNFYRYYWNPTGGENGSKSSMWFNSEYNEVPTIWQNSDLYFSVHPSNKRKSSHARAEITDIAAVNCLFAEFDTTNAKDAVLADIRKLSTPPSAIIDSGGGYHCYWLLGETFIISTDVDRERIQNIQYAWISFIDSSDDGAKDLARVLRVPGTKNNKYDQPLTVAFVEYNDKRTYSLDALEKLVQPFIADRQAQAATQNNNKTFTPIPLDDQEIIDRMLASNTIGINQLWSGDISAYGNDHSDADQALCNHLAFWFGGDAERMDRSFRQSGLYRDKWERTDYRERTLDRSIRDCREHYDPDKAKISNAARRAAMGAVGLNGTQPAQASSQPQGNQANLSSLEQVYLSQLPFDEGNAQCVYAKYGDIFIYCDAYGWMVYNGTHWESEGAESRLKRLTVEVLTERRMVAVIAREETIVNSCKPNNATVNACMSLFKSLVHRSVDIFDVSKDLINCANGTVNLRTGIIQDHSPFDYLTYRLSVAYNPDADYVDWLEFLSKSVSHPEMINYLQTAIGYSITGHVNEECLFYLFGPTRSGKGTFTETILQIIGKPLGVEADFKTFTADREGDTQNFDLAPLKPSRFIVSSESSSYEALNEAKVKQITGGNYIRCAYKRKDHFEYKPQFKIWLVSNHPVKGDVDDDAFWGRLRVIEFPNSNLGKEDKTLKAKLSTPKMLEGILAWAIAGSIEWHQSSSGLTIPDPVKVSTANQRNDLDYIGQWIAEECDDTRSATNITFTSGSDLYVNYETWCKRNGINSKKRRSFTIGLSKKGFDHGPKDINGKTHRVVYGLSIK